MSNEVRFDGRVALVTGSGRGLGREFALLLARRGASVAVNDIGVAVDAGRYGGEDLAVNPTDAVVAEIEAFGGVANSALCDITDASAVSRMVAETIATYGRLDIVINNAGIILSEPFETQGIDSLVSCFDVHVRGAYAVAQAAWPYLRTQQYGRVLNVCSVEGMLFGSRGMAAYDAAKGAMVGLTRALATEGRDDGIQVNGLLPGARTRGQRSTSAATKPGAHVDMSPALVAPAACWVVHEDCQTTGMFFTASSGRVGRVLTGVARGFQALPRDFTLEAVRDHWAEAVAPEGFETVESALQYNAFRTASYDRVVTRAGGNG
jgi:NAD(P)-dependent dehydrogenase (short-subunit alcohol dehydrogenase family)